MLRRLLDRSRGCRRPECVARARLWCKSRRERVEVAAWLQWPLVMLLRWLMWWLRWLLLPLAVQPQALLLLYLPSLLLLLPLVLLLPLPLLLLLLTPTQRMTRLAESVRRMLGR